MTHGPPAPHSSVPRVPGVSRVSDLIPMARPRNKIERRSRDSEISRHGSSLVLAWEIYSPYKRDWFEMVNNLMTREHQSSEHNWLLVCHYVSHFSRLNLFKIVGLVFSFLESKCLCNKIKNITNIFFPEDPSTMCTVLISNLKWFVNGENRLLHKIIKMVLGSWF